MPNRKLSTGEILAIEGRELKLEDIPIFAADFKAALGRVDTDAYSLLDADYPHAILAHGEPWALEANMRIATALNAALDPKAKNVVLLKARLRRAELSDRRGVTFSGIDILAEITALVEDRSIGEIKLDSDQSSPIVLVTGASVTDTRLAAEQFEIKRFALKPSAQRAVPNAFLHEVICSSRRSRRSTRGSPSRRLTTRTPSTSRRWSARRRPGPRLSSLTTLRSTSPGLPRSRRRPRLLTSPRLCRLWPSAA